MSEYNLEYYVTKMMRIRGFNKLEDNSIYVNEENHAILVWEINDREQNNNIEKEFISLKHVLYDSRLLNIIDHIILIYTGNPTTINIKNLKETSRSFLSNEDKVYKIFIEIFLEDEIKMFPIDGVFGPDQIIIYPSGTDVNIREYSAILRFSTINDQNIPNYPTLDKTDILVKYLNLQPGDIVKSKHDRGYDKRVCSVTYKSYIVSDEIISRIDKLGLSDYNRNSCGCTFYNNL